MFRLYSTPLIGEPHFRGHFDDLAEAERVGNALIHSGEISRFVVLDDTGRELIYRQFVWKTYHGRGNTSSGTGMAR